MEMKIARIAKIAMVSLLLLSAEGIYAKTFSWQKRFIQSEPEKTKSGDMSKELMPDTLRCADTKIKFRQSISGGPEVLVPFEGTPNGSTVSVLCSESNLLHPSGQAFNAGKIKAECVTGVFQISDNCDLKPAQGCSRDNGYGNMVYDPNTETYGGCQLTGCNGGYSFEGGVCYYAGSRACGVTNGSGIQPYIAGSNGTGYGACQISGCNSGYHVEGGQCLSNSRTCAVSNGSGVQNYNGGWGACVATSCNSPYVLNGGKCVFGYGGGGSDGNGDGAGY
ncbi:hypothetical protein D3C87_109520 [compost metagenome]